ncbi:MAG: hypothetical protein Q4B67_08975 [Eubacteriales bacterium]|nr:hypothetical protein [Eubacteriales bacterium]
MKELTNDIFYTVLGEYDDCIIDYCLLVDDAPYAGESSHRRAIEAALSKCSLKVKEPWTYDLSRARASKFDANDLLFFPEAEWKIKSGKTTAYDKPYEDTDIPYWFAFVEPPHGTSPVERDGVVLRDEYGREDFDRINEALFPNGTEELEVYKWSTDWSEYFEPGLEWWGAACWSIYDKTLGRYVVIMASATD